MGVNRAVGLGLVHDSRCAMALRFMETTKEHRIVKCGPFPYNLIDAMNRALFFGVDSL